MNVDFGLIPACSGALEGTITDKATGQALAGTKLAKKFGAFFASVFADDTGHYVIPKLPLGFNNAPASYTLMATVDDYWFNVKTVTVECGTVAVLDFEMVAFEFGSMSGIVYVGEPDPNDLSQNRVVTPTTTTIEGANVSLASSTNAKTDSSGFYSFDELLGNVNNAPMTSVPQVSKTGFWTLSASPVLIEPNKHIDASYAIVPQCTANITGTLVFSDTGLPADLIQVRITHPFNFKDFDITDANGAFAFPDRLLGYNNSSVNYNVKVSVIPGYIPA